MERPDLLYAFHAFWQGVYRRADMIGFFKMYVDLQIL